MFSDSHFKSLLAGLVLLPGLSLPLRAESIPAEAATYIQAGSAKTMGYGASAEMQVKNSDTRSYRRIAILKFPKITSKVGNAELRLTMAPPVGKSDKSMTWSFQLYGTGDLGQNVEWYENDLTWELTPGTSNDDGGALYDPWQPLDSVSIQGKGKDGDQVIFADSRLTQFVSQHAASGFVLAVTRIERSTGEADNIAHVFYSDNADTELRPALETTP